MKMTRKVLALILALVMVMGLAVSAAATETPVNHSVVNNTTTHNYEAYQIFKGTQNPSDPALGQIDWGTGVNDPAALLAELKTDLYAFDACTTAAEVAGVLAGESGGTALANKFANIVEHHLSDKKVDIAANASDVTLAPGYYLLKDVTVLTPDPETGELEDAMNPALMQVTGYGAVQINKKYDVTEHEKDILTLDDNGDHNHVDVEQYSIGDTVEFHLKATLPDDVTGYDQYRLVFHDRLSAGLTFKEILSVTIDNNPAETTLYNVSKGGNCTKESDPACNLEVVFADIMQSQYFKPNAVVIVKYTAVLNEGAKINLANPNDSRVEFSNDPSWDPDDPNNTGKIPPTGSTPWEHVEVYTTGVELLKRDGVTDHALQGAEFTITGEGVNIVLTTTNKFTAYATGETEFAKGKYWLLNDGTYTMTDPNTTGIDQSKYADLTTVYYNETVVVAKGTGKAETVVSAYVGEDGMVRFDGLGAGEYDIEETKVPAGYNKIENMHLIISFNHSTKQFSYAWSGGAQGARPVIEVDNNRGSTLPETGGMGTTLFYVIGTVMVLGSAILLVTKKRMIAE